MDSVAINGIALKRIRSRFCQAGLVIGLPLALLLTSCLNSRAESNNTAPTITNFTATSITGGAAFSWSVTDTDSDDLTCALDVDGDGVTDINISACQTTTSQSYAYATPGTYTSLLTATDGYGNSATATITTIAAGTSTTPTIWTAQFGTSNDDDAAGFTTDANGITTDANGNTTLVGTTSGALPGHTNAGGRDIILAKYLP